MDNFQIKILVFPNGNVKTSLEVDRGEPTPIRGLALYSKLEPEILKFKSAVMRTISAQPQKGKN